MIGRKMRSLLPITIAMIVTGCVSPGNMPPDTRPIKPVVVKENQVCETKFQCESMWAEAQDASGLGGMRIRIATETRIETFAPTGFNRVGVVVEKYPVGIDKYEIRPRFFCYGGVNCFEIENNIRSLFNRQIELSKINASLIEENNKKSIEKNKDQKQKKKQAGNK